MNKISRVCPPKVCWPKVCWILKDDRPGNYSQIFNLADGLELQYQVKEISYNKWAFLPSLFKFGLFSNITNSSKSNLINQLENKEQWPDLVISAGRRSALVALDLKKIYPDLFLINIMNPGPDLIKKFAEEFSIVIVPDHDKISDRVLQKNIIKITGSIATIKPEQLEKSYLEFADILEKISAPKIAILLGGSSKNAKFNIEDAKNIRQITDAVCGNMGANLLVTTSRRTDQFLVDEIEKNNQYLKFLFKWQKDAKNPYFALLKDADFIVVTGDSISMCSEACALGKPVYIYANDRICSKKHLKFQEKLFAYGFAKYLSKDLTKLELRKSKKLDELARIRPIINEILKNRIDINHSKN